MKYFFALVILISSVFGLKAQDLMSYTVEVSGACGMCKERIEKVALGKGKAETADWDSESQMLTVEIDEEKTSISRVRYEISLEGHDSGQFLAPTDVYDKLHFCCQYRPEEENKQDDRQSLIELSPTQIKDGNSTYEFEVNGICGMCETRIVEAALSMPGIKSAEWDVNTKNMIVVLDEQISNIEEVGKTLSDLGHDNSFFEAHESAYDNLHPCCKYRDVEVINAHHPKDVFKDVEKVKSNNKAVDGYVRAIDEGGDTYALIGATITSGNGSVGTTTNEDGYFVLENVSSNSNIIISYIGFETQTIGASTDQVMDITLADGVQLKTVEISYKKRTTEISLISTLNSEKITRDELCKAACCNLSESFETNPSVDISYNDAVTGTTQIQMLGLAGPYVQINRELIPDIRGMNNTLGLNMTPGPWIESIQLIKGPGSVVNGFESIAGQINVELKKPHKGEILHVNGYANNGGRMEINTNVRTEVADKVSTNILFHGKYIQGVHDRNDDGFTDMPRERDYLFVNRWNLEQTKNFQGQFGVKIASFDHSGGSHDHFAGISDAHEEHWQMYNQTNRNEVWGKFGYIAPDNPSQSVGLQWSLVDHTQKATFGNRFYDNDQQSLYANLIYQNFFF